MREQAIVLIHKAQLSLSGRYVPYVGSVKEDAAGVTGKHAADGLQEYGLAGTRAAQDSKDFPHLDGKGDGRQCKTASFYGKIVDNQLVHRMNTCLLFLSAGLASRRERKRVSPEIISISIAVAMAAWLSPVDMLR